MSIALPSIATPKRVLLRGFEQSERPAVSKWIRSCGIEVIQLPSLADLIVAGPEAPADLIQKCSVRASKVIAWDEFRSLLEARGALDSNGMDPSRGGASRDLSENGEGIESSIRFSGDWTGEGPAIPPVERRDGVLRILDLKLPLRMPDPDSGGWIPTGRQFLHLCHDKPFLESLRAVALGILHHMPVALEGDTAASKTTAALFLAHALAQPVVRINLSGHTDASELVGRYVPADSSGVIDWSELGPETAWLGKSSRTLLARAAKEGRQLSATERHALLGREGFSVNSWRFQEGLLPQAMRRGWWVLLDELNLAETQVLERINCALESPPGLVLTEGDGTIFGEGGEVSVHDSFRMLATLNPSDYAGRAVLSEAFMDRWSIWHQAATPGERELEQMLRFLTFGEQPRVILAGQAYRAPDTAPLYPELQTISSIGPLLQRLAVFHHGLFKAAGGGGNTPSIGRQQKSRYSFTRRILINLVHYVSNRIRSGASPEEGLIQEALHTFYLARIRGEADRKAVSNILRAGGLL
jgi:MoxR-like ATPase